MRALPLLALVALSGAACGKTDAGPPDPGSSRTASREAALVSEVDFEEEADAQIHAENVESELAALEKEIASDASAPLR